MQQNFSKIKVNNTNAVNSAHKIITNGANDTNKVRKPKQKKKKRLIIRNLSFKVEEDDLKEIFSKFGTLKEVKIPLKEDGKKRGFGFVEFDDTKSLIKAMKTMNYQEIKGRKVAVDFAVDKNSYQLKVQALRQANPELNEKMKYESEIKKEPTSDEDVDEDQDDDSEDEDEKRLNDFLKEFDSGAEKLTKNRDGEEVVSTDESSSDESEEENSDEEEKPTFANKKIKQESDDDSASPRKSKDSRDVAEGRTIFLRNVSYASSQESLREAMEEFGECEYCLLCMDQYTDHPKGTAFVKFREKESADKLVKESYGEPGVLVDGRKLTCSYAMSREDASHVGEDTKKPKDKRNLYLLRVGLIMANSKESEGVSIPDMTKRAQLEIVKKQKLRNVNFFVSDKRLMIHNLPRTYTDSDLRKLFKKAAGSGAVITEARVMKEFKKIDVQGTPLSKGYGFVSFSKHEDALKALNELNNNPSIFLPQKRPIVEFSIENKVALLSQERKKEKMQMRNKRRTEEKKERQSNLEVEDAKKESSESSAKGKKRRKRNKKNKNTVNNTEEKMDIAVETTESPKSPKKKKRRKPKQSMKEKKLSSDRSKESMTSLVNKFKNKLVNKIT